MATGKRTRADAQMDYDPDEIVTLHGHAKMTLKTAVAKVMALPPQERATATIFREGEPSILDAAQIEAIARIPGFENSKGHKAAAHDVDAVGVDRRQTVPRRKCDDQPPMLEHAPARRRD